MSVQSRVSYYTWALGLLDRLEIAKVHVHKATRHESKLLTEQLESLQYLLDAIEEVDEQFSEFNQLLAEDEEQ